MRVRRSSGAKVTCFYIEPYHDSFNACVPSPSTTEWILAPPAFQKRNTRT